MKNRRIVVVALMLVAVICVGVGYAALQDEITFTGKVSYEPDFQLVFDQVVGGNDASEVTDANVDENGNLTVSVDTTAWVIGQTKTFTATVKNESRYNAVDVAVSTVSKTGLDNYTITATLDNGVNSIAALTGTATVTITITMNSYPVEKVENIPFSFNVTANQGDSATQN